ncbi:MAG: bifunctional hydroxymethylpyrimidine kinase/phosphomethylpyrimidine kinase [Acidimicrobiales bacterium]
MSTTPPVGLTIAGSDSGGGAGIAADLRTFAAHGVFGTLAVTAVTAQDTRRVRAVQAVSAEMVAAQIEAVCEDLSPKAAKTGMLASAEIVKTVTARAAGGALPPLVIDPVLVASSGDPLFEGGDVQDAYRDLLSLSCVVTPNLFEASLLVGREIKDLPSMEEAARELHGLGARLVIVKGGHLKGKEAIDVAFDGRAVTLLRAPWVETPNVHGTGCSFSAAICAELALGREPLEAALRAKAYVHRAISLAARWRLGAGHGPIDHLGAAGFEG